MVATTKSTGKKTNVARTAKAAKPGTTGRAANQNELPAGQIYKFDEIFLSAPNHRIAMIKRGIPARHVGELAARMDVSKESLVDSLRLSRATLNRKVREKKVLSPDESERVLGMDYLIGQVENMVRESGNADGFDAPKWLSNWLNSPLPALGNETPATYMDTIEGQKLVSNLLAMAQSGAYA